MSIYDEKYDLNGNAIGVIDRPKKPNVVAHTPPWTAGDKAASPEPRWVKQDLEYTKNPAGFSVPQAHFNYAREFPKPHKEEPQLNPGEWRNYGNYKPNKSSLPADAKARKSIPVVTGFLDYFPDAAAAVAELSLIANEQHNPGQPLHWAREKSFDHADCLGRHLLERGKIDSDGVRHSAKVAWRALAMLQLEIEESKK